MYHVPVLSIVQFCTVFVGLALAAFPAAAYVPVACADRDAILARLGAKYDEAPSGIGIANNGSLIELLTTADGSSWTLLVSMPDGKSCLLAAGENWTPVEHVVRGPEL